MRALIQRVSHASVHVEDQLVGAIGRGLLVLLGVGQGDDEAQVRTLVEKIVHLRIFEDEAGKMNRSLLDIHGEMLVVSQFTLYADVRRGRRVTPRQPQRAGTLCRRPGHSSFPDGSHRVIHEQPAWVNALIRGGIDSNR